MMSFPFVPDPGGESGHRRRALLLPASLIVIFTMLIIAAACAPLYVSNPVHAPMMERAGEIHAAGYIGTGIYSFNASASVTDHLLLIGSYSFDPLQPRTSTRADSIARHLGHTFWEGGAGWYTRFGEGMKLELIGGYGAGSTSANRGNDSIRRYGFVYRADGEYHRIFAQAAIGGSIDGLRPWYIDPASSWAAAYQHNNLGLALRTSYLWFSRFQEEPFPARRPSALFIEPVFFLRNGWRNFQTELQIGATIKTFARGGDFRSQWFFLGLGVHCILDGLW